jgi:hypothetical protein
MENTAVRCGRFRGEKMGINVPTGSGQAPDTEAQSTEDTETAEESDRLSGGAGWERQGHILS